MPLIHLDDPADPRLRDFAGVRNPAALKARGLLVAEGRFVVGRLVERGWPRVRALLMNDAAWRSMAGALDRLSADVEVFLAPPSIIEGITGFNLHRGCLAVAERPALRSMDALVASSGLVVLAERVLDADNVGSIFRNAEAFGADAVLLSPGCCDPWYRKAVRTSSGASLVVPFAEAAPWPEALGRLRAAGFTVVATTPAAESVSVGAFVASDRARGRLAVLVGTEGGGLSAEALALADVCIRIPMAGAVDSLNVATAVGITLQRLHEVRQMPARASARR